MNKITYARRLAATTITDIMTVAAAKTASRERATLNRFWRTAATRYLRQQGIDLTQMRQSTRVEIIHDLRPTGTVRIEIWDTPSAWGDFGAVTQPDTLRTTYRIPKSKLYK